MSNVFGLNRFILLCFMWSTFNWGCTQTESSVSEEFVAWVREEAISIESFDAPLPTEILQSIHAAIGPATVVGIGESRHDAREQILLKSLLVRSMIEDLGFRALILEESCPHAESLDHYVTSGKGDLSVIMNNLAGWYLWDTEEMFELILWIHEFNKDLVEDMKVRIFGMDITTPALATIGLKKFLDDANIESGMNEQDFGLDLQEGDFWPITRERYAQLSEKESSVLQENHDKVIKKLITTKRDLIANSSLKEYKRALLLAEIGRAGNNFFSSTDLAEAGVIRENGMASTALWYLDNEIPGEKAIVWGHNLHVATSPFSMPDLMEGTFRPMGILLREALSEDYIAIGATFGEGSFPPDLPPGERHFEKPSIDVMDGAFAAVGYNSFLIDIRKVRKDSSEEKWLNQARAWRAQDAESFLVPATSFDLVYFVKNISRAQPSPLALERFQSMRN